MVITTIDGINLYSTPQEAINEALAYNLIGYHTHVFKGITGYMAGRTHSGVLSVLGINAIASQQLQPTQQNLQPIPQLTNQTQQPTQQLPTQQLPVQVVQTPIPVQTTTTTTSSSSGGGGGY